MMPNKATCKLSAVGWTLGWFVSLLLAWTLWLLGYPDQAP